MMHEDRELLARLAVLSKAVSVVVAQWLGADLYETGLPPDALRSLAADLDGVGRLLRKRADEIEG
jgi:hypothetical protein